MGLESLPSFRDRTVLIAANGPCIADIRNRHIPPHIDVVAVKDAWEFFPQCKIIYACDWKWWIRRGILSNLRANTVRAVGKLPDKEGMAELGPASRKWLMELTKIGIQPGVGPLIWHGPSVRGGWNSACQILNAVLRRGASQILLAGIDCDAPHSYSDRPAYSGQMPQTQRNIDAWIEQWRIIHNTRGVGERISNVCPSSKLDVFPKWNLYDAVKEYAHE